jgi:hypothetical protein
VLAAPFKFLVEASDGSTAQHTAWEVCGTGPRKAKRVIQT